MLMLYSVYKLRALLYVTCVEGAKAFSAIRDAVMASNCLVVSVEGCVWPPD